MSGGHFDYNQFHIDAIADSIEYELEKQGKLDEDAFHDKIYNPTHSEIVQKKMRKAVKYLKIASVYAHRIDWYLSGDDDESDFLRRLDEDLNGL